MWISSLTLDDLSSFLDSSLATWSGWERNLGNLSYRLSGYTPPAALLLPSAPGATVVWKERKKSREGTRGSAGMTEEWWFESLSRGSQGNEDK